jgi:hypothetical protein
MRKRLTLKAPYKLEPPAIPGRFSILDFNHLEDTIWLKGSYTYSGENSGPLDGQYGVWNNGNGWVITWNSVDDTGWHDILVKGDNPLGSIAFY